MTTQATPLAPMPQQAEVAIIGAGIGGLAAAVALRQAGFDVQVFERAPVSREIGGAVVIREPAVRLFRQWGIDTGFLAGAVPVDIIEQRDARGVLQRTMSADFTGEGQAYVAHRADVHRLLLAAVPRDRIHLGAAATEVVNEQWRAVARFDTATTVAARLVVGADGIRSVTRRAVVQDELVFARLVVLRGTAPASALPAGVGSDRITLWTRDKLLISVLPMRGGTLVALDAAITQDEPPADLWNNQVPTATLLDTFRGFDQGLLDLIKAGDTAVLAHPVYERQPIRTWSAGRITLLGDAAHPMAPRQGQGANQALLDAGALAESLNKSGLGNPEAALWAYQDLRVGPATAMQLASRGAPPATARIADTPQRLTR